MHLSAVLLVLLVLLHVVSIEARWTKPDNPIDKELIFYPELKDGSPMVLPLFNESEVGMHERAALPADRGTVQAINNLNNLPDFLTAPRIQGQNGALAGANFRNFVTDHCINAGGLVYTVNQPGDQDFDPPPVGDVVYLSCWHAAKGMLI